MVLDRSKEAVRERDDWNQADGTMEDKKMETETIKERQSSMREEIVLSYLCRIRKKSITKLQFVSVIAPNQHEGLSLLLLLWQ